MLFEQGSRPLAQWQALVGTIGSGAGRRGCGSLQRSSGENWSTLSGSTPKLAL